VNTHKHLGPHSHPHCCPCGCTGEDVGLSRRTFLGAAGCAALTGLSWSLLSAAEADAAPEREPLVVKPVFAYTTYGRRNQTSWRSWGGIEKQQDADQEMVRIRKELEQLTAKADFPLRFLPLSPARGAGDVAKMADLAQADAFLIYAANGSGGIFDAIAKHKKPTVFFLRHRSGPLSLWYEIISPRYVRRHGDRIAQTWMSDDDVVVDSLDDVTWRLRALCGLRNTIGSRIVTIGGASGWAHREAPQLAVDRWKLDIQNVPYPELGRLIQAARADKDAVARAAQRAAAYLKQPGVKLETQQVFVENCFLLEQVFRGILARTKSRAITINSCMGTIMPIAQTTACLTLSLLNDAGYLAFCESDFVVVPAGILMAGITGHPAFLNDPTYPHHNIITLAHCTAPRRMDGKTLEPVRVLTHFESDYGAAPKVEMRKGMRVTNILTDFAAKRWLGLGGEIIDAPFLPICRSQIDVQFKPDAQLVAERMTGFHWMTVYGDYLREAGYALRKTKVAWEDLG